LIEGLLFGVTPTDPFTFAFAAAAMAVASFSAAFLPAWRAARVAPATALRTE
jgi:ABC-type lipoprotein release transport system permease subunit